MNYLSNKKVLLIVCGSIAAYKAAYLVRGLIKKGAEVKVVMTPSASNFISPLTLATLSKNECLTDFERENGKWNNHVDLGLWADYLLIAPASANTLAKMANGICDNLAMACYLSAKCPVFFAPGMDLDMYKHPSTKQNIAKIQSYGNTLIPVESGELASGLVGEGRMAEPENIIAFLENQEGASKELAGKKVLITAGPTYEKIDPVRFIGNFSSGKMGFALAEACLSKGADVTLIAGPNQLKASANIHQLDVLSAEDMLNAVQENISGQNIVIMSAAVADYTPAHKAENKIKKNDQEISLELKKTTDILKTVGKNKAEGQILVGFALETENETEHAIGKLERKNLDFIVLNSLNDKGAGFGHDTNKICIIDRSKNKKDYPLMSKSEVANVIVKEVIAIC